VNLIRLSNGLALPEAQMDIFFFFPVARCLRDGLSGVAASSSGCRGGELHCWAPAAEERGCGEEASLHAAAFEAGVVWLGGGVIPSFLLSRLFQESGQGKGAEPADAPAQQALAGTQLNWFPP